MEYRITMGESLTSLGREAWNDLTSISRNPLYAYEWLSLLEDSGSISPEYGWFPLHLCVRHNDSLVAVLPMYGKDNSHGEYVYDYAWADLAGQLNIPYYPKLVGTVPATPSGYYRCFTTDRKAELAVQEVFSGDLFNTLGIKGIAGVSFLFADASFGSVLEGFVPWENQSFIWINRGYRDFQDYIADFKKNQRRNIRREWASLESQGLDIHILTGTQLTSTVMDTMYDLYLRTNDQFGSWAARYLNRRFFEMLPDYFSSNTVIFAAVPRGKTVDDAVAMSMCLYNGDWVFGRYWGTREELTNLHFNLCYYAPIRWMIEKGISYLIPGLEVRISCAEGLWRILLLVITASLMRGFSGSFRNI